MQYSLVPGGVLHLCAFYRACRRVVGQSRTFYRVILGWRDGPAYFRLVTHTKAQTRTKRRPIGTAHRGNVGRYFVRSICHTGVSGSPPPVYDPPTDNRFLVRSIQKDLV